MVDFFGDAGLQKAFEKNGFVVIPMLDPKEVEALNSSYNSFFSASPDHFYSSSFIEDPERKLAINEGIQTVLSPHIRNTFRNIKHLGSSFLVKPTGPSGKMQVHQDWTVVDESKYWSVTVWIPLTDTTANNGAIRVLPGSHLFFDDLRGPSIPVVYEDIYEDIWEEMDLLEMKAGEAFVFSHSLIHASNINDSGKDRVAVTLGFYPDSAELLFFHLNENGKIEKFEVPDDFFQRYTQIGERPEIGKKVEELDFSPRSVTKFHFKNKLLMSKSMRPLFKDKTVQEEFGKNGFVKLQALDQKDIDQLIELYHETGIKDSAGYGFFISMDNEDQQLVNQTMDKIFEVALPKVLPHFENAKAFTASFVIKDPNPKGVVPIHQDWTFVDNEGEFTSVTCWIALVDTSIENGAMGAIKGSHDFLPSVRPSPSPQVVSPLRDLLFSLFPYVQMIPMKAGEALIFDNRTFHASPPNISDKPRLAVGLGFTQKEASLAHYFMKPGGKQDKILKYAIDKDFFRKYNNARLSRMYDTGEMIQGYNLISEEDYEMDKPDKEELIAEIKAAGNTFNVPLVEHLAKLFDYNPDGSKKEESLKANGHQQQNGNGEQKSFWQVYTPYNIYREIRYRITGK